MGAIASGGVQVVNEQVAGRLGLGEADLRRAAEAEAGAGQAKALPGGPPPPDLRGKIVLLVDDGLATGSTMRAAVAAVRAGLARVVVAVPTAPAPASAWPRRPTRWSAPAPRARSGRRLLLPVVPQTSDEEVGRFSRPRGGAGPRRADAAGSA